MIIYLVQRLISIIPVALGVIVIVSAMTQLVPGDPTDMILGDYASLEDKQALRHALGLDEPPLTQTLNYIKNVLQGDLGESLVYSESVSSMIWQRVPATVELAIVSLMVAILIALPLGFISAYKKDTGWDLSAMTFAVAGVAIPNFWLGPLLVLFFSLNLGLLPVSERTDWTSYVLPAITMGTALAAALSRMTRNSILDAYQEDYVRTARAKGCGEKAVLVRHVFRNAALPLVTVVGLQFGVLLTGAVITEKIFDWPGLGSLLVEGIQTRDYPVIQGCVLVFASSYLVVNIVTDVVYALIDPRIKLNQ